ncbi:MAG TPA: hypothetical protein VK589_11525, partial [Chryseolinea sp.]|nr:hypothetical protein [Chryseolinea sp.]
VWGAIQFSRKLTFDIADWQKEAALFALQEGKALIGRDPINPGIQLGIFAKGIDGFMDLYENVLGQVIGIVMVNDHLANMPIHPLLIFANEQIETVIPGLWISNFE